MAPFSVKGVLGLPVSSAVDGVPVLGAVILGSDGGTGGS